MLREELVKLVKKAAADSFGVTFEPQIERPREEGHGDYSSNAALILGKELNKNPKEVAETLKSKIKKPAYIEKIEIAGPGFINFYLSAEFLRNQISKIITEGNRYGSSSLGKGKKARVEFVSANPTGPLHFGNARGGPIGDTLANVLGFSGYEVMREYLNNDRGNQILELGKTIAERAGLLKADEEELTYKGEYINELANKLKSKLQDLSQKPRRNPSDPTGQVVEKAGEEGVKIMFEEIIKDCEATGIKFDYIVHESELQKDAPKILAGLEKKGLLEKREGATWFGPRQRRGSPEAADAVVIKSDGNYTYFTADVVYHTEKFESGYDLVIDVFGSNTSGHVPKLKALAKVLNYDLHAFKVILYQFVRIKRGENVLKMSKRAGNFVTAREVLDEVGRDAFRYFILSTRAETHMDFDLELAKKRANENPVFYIQYAHARISSILAKSSGRLPHVADDVRSTSPKNQSNSRSLNLRLSSSSEDKKNKDVTASGSSASGQPASAHTELDLIRELIRFPELVEEIAQSLEVHKITTYAFSLADKFHRFYEQERVISEDKELTNARLELVKATQIVLKNTLRLLGISAPEKM